mmetsp:Transcript_27771/g.60725  ORF Transcript_27771/g.60725 Transcript_27771/m.60725 type:complete len:266 (-) Transcript_27771:247-1044(-)
MPVKKNDDKAEADEPARDADEEWGKKKTSTHTCGRPKDSDEGRYNEAHCAPRCLCNIHGAPNKACPWTDGHEAQTTAHRQGFTTNLHMPLHADSALSMILREAIDHDADVWRRKHQLLTDPSSYKDGMRLDDFAKVFPGLYNRGVSEKQVFVDDVLRETSCGAVRVAGIEVGIELLHDTTQACGHTLCGNGSPVCAVVGLWDEDHHRAADSRARWRAHLPLRGRCCISAVVHLLPDSRQTARNLPRTSRTPTGKVGPSWPRSGST